MFGTILKIFGGGFAKILFWSLDKWMKRIARDNKMTKSYYGFLDAVDKSGAANVANYIAAENALAGKQKEIRDRLAKRKQNLTEGLQDGKEGKEGKKID